jgi:hypothetical protein
MNLKFALIYHVILVAAVYITAYRTGFKACQLTFRRRAARDTAPLAKMLEQLNLKVEDFLDERNDERNNDGRQ